MTWLIGRLKAWWRGRRRRVMAPKAWPQDRVPGVPRFAPQRIERLPSGDAIEEADARIERLDWRIRELEREQQLERERWRRGHP